MTDSFEQLSRKTIVLHWLVGIGIIGLMATGIYMEENEVYALYPLHKSIGVLIILPVLWRIVWRKKNGWPKPVRDYSNIEQRLSKIVHWALIIGTALMPISGMMMSVAGGHGLDFFGLELVVRNADPANPQEVIALNPTAAQIGHILHGLGGKIILAAIALHLVGALKHHVFDKDRTLKRMLGSTAS